MKKFNKVAMVLASAALASVAGAQSVDNWRNGTGEMAWKNGTAEYCWRNANWTPANAVAACDGAIAAPKAAAPAPAPAAAAPAPAASAPVAAPAAQGTSMAGVAMPAAAKLMADNNLATGSVAGSGKDGRVTKGDVLSAVAGGVQSTAGVIPTGAPTKALPQVAAPAAVNLGDRPEQRVPMTRLRARVAERLLP